MNVEFEYGHELIKAHFLEEPNAFIPWIPVSYPSVLDNIELSTRIPNGSNLTIFLHGHKKYDKNAKSIYDF